MIVVELIPQTATDHLETLLSYHDISLGRLGYSGAVLQHSQSLELEYRSGSCVFLSVVKWIIFLRNFETANRIQHKRSD